MLTSVECWRRIAAADEFPAIGMVYDEGPILNFEPNRFEPIVAKDEEDYDRMYLPAQLEPVLVVSVFPDLVWLAPFLTESDFVDRDVFESLLQRGWDPEACGGWLALPEIQGFLPRSLVPICMPTVVASDFLTKTEAPRLTMTITAIRGHLMPAFSALHLGTT
jgi:hypothetical protein